MFLNCLAGKNFSNKTLFCTSKVIKVKKEGRNRVRERTHLNSRQTRLQKLLLDMRNNKNNKIRSRNADVSGVVKNSLNDERKKKTRRETN